MLPLVLSIRFLSTLEISPTGKLLFLESRQVSIGRYDTQELGSYRGFGFIDYV